jgi:hypothetical protein
MGFARLCTSDPVLDFIRDTYDAIPMKMPDARMAPLTLFAHKGGKFLFLGEMRQVASSWSSPGIDEVDLPDLSGVISNNLSWSAALSLLPSFVAAALTELSLAETTAALETARQRSRGVRISIARAKRAFVSPLVLAQSVQSASVQLPWSMGIPEEFSVYVVDSVLTAKEISLSVEGESAIETAMQLETSLAGKVGSDMILRRKAELTITGKVYTPFAFTCLSTSVTNGMLLSISVSQSRRLRATAVDSITVVPHSIIGGRDELFSMDN